MKKILITGDWHLDARTAGQRRYEDIGKVALETVEAAAEANVTHYVFAGDLCDPDSPCVFRALDLARTVAARLWAYDINSFWLVGNHDVVEDGSGDHVLLPLGDEGSMVIDEPCVRQGIAFFPYTALAKRYDPETQLAVMKGDHSAASTYDKVKLVVSHLQLKGVTPGGEKDFARGRDEFLPVDAIRAAWPNATIVNAHYHQPGLHDGVILSGSLVPLTKADTGKRGYTLVEVT